MPLAPEYVTAEDREFAADMKAELEHGETQWSRSFITKYAHRVAGTPDMERAARKRHAVEIPDPAHPGQTIPVTFAEAQPGDGKDGARKMDVGKAPVVCGFINYFPRAMNAVALVSEYGARKYNDGAYKTAWQEVPNGFNRYDDAVGRHLTHAAVEPYDDESQIAHLAHRAWNAMAALELALKNGQVELRQGNQVAEGRPIRDTYKAVKL